MENQNEEDYEEEVEIDEDDEEYSDDDVSVDVKDNELRNEFMKNYNNDKTKEPDFDMGR